MYAALVARTGNNPKRRIAPSGTLSPAALYALADALPYAGSGNHKRYAGDYGFDPPSNPRAWKSLCDDKRPLLKDEAASLFEAGVKCGMISMPGPDGKPKFVWSVDFFGEVYEANLGSEGHHGYRLSADDDMAKLVLSAWRERRGDV